MACFGVEEGEEMERFSAERLVWDGSLQVYEAASNLLWPWHFWGCHWLFMSRFLGSAMHEEEEGKKSKM
jgi:hypothetical protein